MSLKYLFYTFSLIILCLQAEANVGFKQMKIEKSHGFAYDMNATLWYPTKTNNKLKIVGDNLAFYGILVEENASFENDGYFPLIILSHGYRGSWRNLNWLAAKLVDAGFIVVAPEHIGTTTFDIRTNEKAKLWLRPNNISMLLDFLLNKSEFSSNIDKDRIAIIGHSLGGWTSLILAGAKFEPNKFIANCKKSSQNDFLGQACSLIVPLGLNLDETNKEFADRNLADKHIKAIVSLDAGLTKGFTKKSLENIKVPILVIAAGYGKDDDSLNSDMAYLRKYLPSSKTEFEILPKASHFSFMMLCKPGATDLLKKEFLGDEIVCLDANEVYSRDALHKTIEETIISFLKKVFRY